MLLNQPMRACLKYVCYKKKMTKHVLNNKKDTSVHFLIFYFQFIKHNISASHIFSIYN